ncbi:hypothetical protein [Flavobacterium sp. GP15]|uniref:hypothetical protein n=1 Tax=Flavobacterium sp. GP15 TaxID=2758567 RepID=UPI00165D79DF|nr:hypothetical protein [Flavobacterium sp. GP15]
MCTNRKVLLISFDFFPDNSPNTYRWIHVVREWERLGIDVFVVSAKKNGEGFDNYQEMNNLKIYRVGGSLLDKFRSNKKKTSLNSKFDINRVKKVDLAKKSFLKKIYDFTWKKVYFPDFAFLWQEPAFKMAKKIIAQEGIYNVISVSWPFSGHVVASRLKNKYHINWIADTIDPFCLSKAVNNNLLYNKINYRYEKQTLKSADIISVLTEKLKKKYMFMFPNLKGKVLVNHNVFIPYSTSISNVQENNDSKIKLVFVGTLTPITRSPENLLKFFVSLLKIESLSTKLELYLYGDLTQCMRIIKEYDFLIGKAIFIKGFVPREAMPSILLDADILINIGNNNEYQEPSKILEYVFLGKPIINVCSIENDSSKEMLREYPLNININPQEIEDQKKCIEVSNFIWSEKSVAPSILKSILEKYMLNEVQSRYFDMLKFD